MFQVMKIYKKNIPGKSGGRVGGGGTRLSQLLILLLGLTLFLPGVEVG